VERVVVKALPCKCGFAAWNSCASGDYSADGFAARFLIEHSDCAATRTT
jgi:hypothetical protein